MSVLDENNKKYVNEAIVALSKVAPRELDDAVSVCDIQDDLRMFLEHIQ